MGGRYDGLLHSLGPIFSTILGQAISPSVCMKSLEHISDNDAKTIILAGPTNMASIGGSAIVRNYSLTKVPSWPGTTTPNHPCRGSNAGKRTVCEAEGQTQGS